MAVYTGETTDISVDVCGSCCLQKPSENPESVLLLTVKDK